MGEPKRFWYLNAYVTLLFICFFFTVHAGVRIILRPGDTLSAILALYLPGLASIALARYGIEEPYHLSALTLALAGLSGTGFAFDVTGMHVLGVVFAVLTAIFWVVAVAEVVLNRPMHDFLLALLCVTLGAGIALGYRYVPATTCLWISVGAFAAFLALVIVGHRGRRHPRMPTG